MIAAVESWLAACPPPVVERKRDTFDSLLRQFRNARGWGCNELARAVQVDPSYISRLERGEREPPRRRVVEGIAAALELNREDQDRLLVGAGYSPAAVTRLGTWDATLQAVAEVLVDPALSGADVAEFRAVVQTLARRWRHSG